MISISGIKYQNELEQLPYFNKQTAEVLVGKKGKNLDKKIKQLIDKDYLVRLKNGLYVTSTYLDRLDNRHAYLEYLANVLRYPSYLSLEYILSINNVIPEAVYSLTSVTIKSTRNYDNKLGKFVYRNIKNDLFIGYREKEFGIQKVAYASVAKALFDYLYLKRNLGDYGYELKKGLRINWDVVREKDRCELHKYVGLSGSVKMAEIMKVIKNL